MRKLNFKKVLFGLSLSLVLAMAIGSFAIGETQTPANTQAAATNGETGDFVVEGGSYGEDADYHFGGTSGTDGVLYIHPQDAGTEITIFNEGTTTDRIEVTKAAAIILAGVDIDRSSITATEEPAALTIVDDATFNVNIFLKDDTNNILKGAAGDSSVSPTISGSPGIQKNGDTNVGMLTITGSTGENAGKLEAAGGNDGAGIGSGKGKNASNITISGGTVTATGGQNGAGIGGGCAVENITTDKKEGGNANNITISGGNITANGGDEGAGIGGGNYGSGDNIIISGGTVTAKGSKNGSGIGGGGGNGNASNITISGGTVTANGGDGGAGIGGGQYGNATKITITDSTVTATGGGWGAGIGGGQYGGNATKITITDSTVTATGGAGSFGIGGVTASNIEIIDSNVKATGGDAQDNPGESFYSGSGIGGLIMSKITISNSVVTATGGSEAIDPWGDIYTPASAIGGGGRLNSDGTWTYYPITASDNHIDSSAVLILKGGIDIEDYSIETLQGFDEASGGSLAGIVFEQKFDSDVITGMVCGDAVLSQDLEIPANLTIPEGSTLSIEKDKEVKLSEKAGAKYIVEGILKNDGTVTLPADIEVNAGGKIETLLNYDPQGGSIKTNNDGEYITYKDKDGLKKYEKLPVATKEGYKLEGWHTEKTGKEDTKVEPTDNVLLNQHTLYANWVLESKHKITIDQPENGRIDANPEEATEGDEVTLTPIPNEGYKLKEGSVKVTDKGGKEIQVTEKDGKYIFTMPNSEVEVSAVFELIHTPTPTPDPSVDPDQGGDGSGSGASSKTGDPFMGGMALALLGVATTGAILTRKIR